MIETPHWQFDIEVRPVNWRFPVRQSWIAGWIRPKSNQGITDVRARLHHRIVLGLSGLPHPAFTVIPQGLSEAIRPGFSFLLSPQPGATLLRLEARDLSGVWTEFFRTIILAAPDAIAPAAAPNLSQSLGRLIALLMKQRRRTPQRSWIDLADELLAAFVAEPLNAHPNAPLIGALEEPRDIGRRRNGCIPVTGWLAHPTAKITRLIAVIDSQPATTLPHSLARADVAGIFPVLFDQTNAAFVGEISLPVDFAAPVLLKLFAELDNGEKHLAYARRFTPRPHGDTGQMPPFVGGFTFACAVWALHRAAGRCALPRHGLIPAARTIWTSYQAAPAYRPKKNSPLLGKTSSPSRDEPSRTHPGGVDQSSSNPLPAAVSALPANSVIAPGDDMCGPDATQYFRQGREALTLVQQAGALAGSGRVEAILDLPCGYGRVARWLRTAYPTARLTVSDTQEPGVAFCVAQLGATGIPATIDGRHWAALPGPYDIIWCGSLLTHFGQDQWVTHLRRFAERLSAHGVLVFTSHGLRVLDKLQNGEKDYGLPEGEVRQLCTSVVAAGFGYVDYPDTPAYGISIAQPGWILECIAQETDLQVLEIREAAWDQHQDIVVCTHRPAKG